MSKALIALAWVLAVAHANSPNLLPLRGEEFGRHSLMAKPSFQLLNPNAFAMQQSYTMSYSGGSYGSHSSGVYLNTLSYQFSIPLVLSLDVGMYNLFHSQMQNAGFAPAGSQDPRTNEPQLILPRVGLEYKPTENMSLSVQLLHYPDALQAYGSPAFGAFGPRRSLRAGDW